MTPREFEQRHSKQWDELEAQLDQPVTRLQPERFMTLYRQCCEQLALAQARGFPAHLEDRLASLTARAHQVLYARSELGGRRLADLLLRQFPKAVRAQRKQVLVAALCLMVPTLALGLAVYLHPELILSIVDSDTAAQFEQMYSADAQAIGRLRNVDSNWLMFGYYIMNNVGIAFQCYATGLAFGIGSLFFLVFNGAYGGGIGGFVSARGHAATFFTFIATHSAFELTAIVLSGAAGLCLGQAALLPGRRTRVAALQAAARDTAPIISGVAVMLLIAAAFEAFWSSAPWIAPSVKFIAAAGCWSVVLYFFLRNPDAR